jgi:gluconolactonase
LSDPVATSSAFEQLFPEGNVVRQLATGFTFTEGPIWHPLGQYLLFSDMPGDVRRRWTPTDGVSEVRRPSNKCNGMTYDDQLNLIVCEHSTSRLMLEAPDGTTQVLASHHEDKELNSPNDVTFMANGSIYFTDPGYGRVPGFGIERDQELDFQGVYRIDKAGALHLERNDFAAPNGLCQSPDGSTMYVNDSERAHIRAFAVDADGSLGEERMFFENIGSGDLAEGIPDGMKADVNGTIYVTGPGGIWVIDADANHLGTLAVPEGVGNMNWGGPDWTTLYICASTSLYSVDLGVAGAHSPYMTPNQA